MKKNVLNKMDEIEKERKISGEAKKEIRNRAIVNAAICISFEIMIIAFILAANFLMKDWAVKIYNICSLAFIVFTIVIFEIGYKKDSGKYAIVGIELLVISIITLFAPYIFLKFSNIFTYFFIALIALYYIIKIAKIYINENNKYLQTINDIQDIVKKESQDELVKEYQEKKNKDKKKIAEKQKDKKSKKEKTTTKTKRTTKPRTGSKETSKPKTQKTTSKTKTTKKTENKENN